MTDKVNIVTPMCFMCMKHSLVYASYQGFLNYQAGALVQVAFPDLSDDDREMIKTGTHPKCWTEMIKDVRGE